jgi:hypothetical protein
MAKSKNDNVENLTKPLVEQAIELGEIGLHVHPLVGKRPVLQKWQERASAEEPKIRAMFDEVPSATNVGVVCGKSGLFVIDLDVNKEDQEGPDGLDWQREHQDELPKTRVHKTPSGGYHMLYFMPKNRLPNVSIAHKVDSRGDNGYIVWPTENSGYTVYQDRKVVELPEDVALKLKQRSSEIGKLSVKELETNIITDASSFALHDLTNQLIYVLAKTDAGADEIIRRVQDVMQKSHAKSKRPSDWQDRYNDINRSVMGAVRRLEGNKVKEDEADLRYKEALAKAGMKSLYEGVVTEDVEPTPETPPPSSGIFEEITLDMLQSAPLPMTKWVMHGVLEAASITGIAGQTNVGKTRWMISGAIAVLTGQMPVIGFDVPRPGSVLIISHEERKGKLHKRLRATAEANGIKNFDNRLRVSGAETSGPLILLTQGEDRRPQLMKKVIDEICKQAKEIDASVIMLDPLVSFSSGISENDAGMQQLMIALREIAERTGCAILIMHHTPKGARNEHDDWYLGSVNNAFRGSGAIAAALDIAFTLSRVGRAHNADDIRGMPPADQKRWLRFVQAKGRETLMDQEAVYFLAEQMIEVQDEHGNIEEESKARDEVADETLAAARRKVLIGKAAEALMDAEPDVAVTIPALRSKMRKIDRKYNASRSVGGAAMSRFYGLFPLIHNGYRYELDGTGRSRKVVRVEAVADD